MRENNRDEDFWAALLEDVKRERCIPFLGAGCAAGVLPTGYELSKRLAERYRYPFEDSDRLDRVTEFIEVTCHREELEVAIVEEFRIVQSLPIPAPHLILANLPFTLYITTNYDDFMGMALDKDGRKSIRIIPPRDIRGETKRFTTQPYSLLQREDSQSEMTVDRPVVFHLHGHIENPTSIVITETDYYKSTAGLVAGVFQLSIDVMYRISKSSLLFIGYSMRDWNLRLLLYALYNRLGHISSVIVFLRDGTSEQHAYMEDYLNRFTRARVYFGTAEDFADELIHRWEGLNT